MKYEIFGGGTCGRNDWRSVFIRLLADFGGSPELFFNPVLPPGTWNEEAREKEDLVKRTARVLMFYLGSPRQDELLPFSAYSLVQLVDSCFSVNRTTRAYINLTRVSTSTAKAFNKSLDDLERISPGLRVNSWPEFVTEIARLWKANKNLLAFLGGTSGNNMWRKRLMCDLRARGVSIERFFDPVVPPGTWTKGVQYLEDQMREACDHEFFYLDSPEEAREDTGQFSAYSIVEAYIALYEEYPRVCLCFDYDGISGHTLKSLQKFEADVRQRFPNAVICSGLSEAAERLSINREVLNRSRAGGVALASPRHFVST